ncbi:type IV secretory system conjugative DNA transfer family protein [Nocardia cyriacigeorgica]|uniref:Type IV secretory system conjugative DNA transfer family protein n=1 Tax=Nocardia cyriacigeorgica TaxID=135487 RepID=A0A5R8PDY1_9NOCA|nr:type IV secretion system DNA-binding domain-containing protein [Nocardia cyriacigeorgica]MBF6095733.1 type IV secretory system conjugative DNA transfer family protein [Nocardia cyriacigeorgica]TLF73665.1 type IV secretory system conjugative DNA transfer family protein [Nocardia cyriacigeorgica]TLG10244.1 type IV secretory system conjugative DNA transfer family protein [Nocardia cyriacigeorgica]
MSAAENPSQGWLSRLLTDPGTALGVLTEPGALLRALVEPGALIGLAGVAVAVLAVIQLVDRLRLARLSRNAREVVVLAPPTVDPAGAVALWSHLVGLLRPRWRRRVLGQPHLGIEYTITPDVGVRILLWVPGTIPPGLVERAVESAWPGARTRTVPARPPLPGPDAGHRRVLAGGELRLARPESLPIRIDYAGGDPVRDLIAAAGDLDPGHAACVQILARPIAGRRVRRLTATGGGTTTRVLVELLDLLTPGPTRRAPRRAPSSSPAADKQAALEVSARTRAAANKARGSHWDTVVRYAVAAMVPADADRATLTHERAVVRGRAHAVAAVFGSATDHNYYRRHRRPHLATVLDRRWLRRGDLLSVPELAGIAHLPHGSGIPGLQRAGARAVAPVAEIATAGSHTKPLGVADTGTGRPVAVRVADARHHLHVLGATGVGKSTLLAQLILDDAERERGLVVVDPKGDLITDILDRLPARHADRVVLFDADSRTRPPCLNPLDTRDADIDLAVDNLVTIFHRIYSQHWGPRTDDVLRASLLTLCAQPGVATLADLPRLLLEEPTRARLTRTIKDPVLQGFWTSYDEMGEATRAQTIAPLLNKLRAFLLRPFVKAAIAAGPSTVDLAHVLDHGGICLARLPKGSLGEETARLVGSLLVARTWQATTARTRHPGTARADASLILDEAHNFLNLSTPVEDMLAEARGLRLSLTLAHQNLGQLSRELREGISANARNKIIFSAAPDDARDLARHTEPWLSSHDLANLDAFHAAARLLVHGQQTPPFTLTTRPLSDPVPGNARTIRSTQRNRHQAATATTKTAAPQPARQRRSDPRQR